MVAEEEGGYGDKSAKQWRKSEKRRRKKISSNYDGFPL
jgi:hypothetical protein